MEMKCWDQASVEDSDVETLIVLHGEMEPKFVNNGEKKYKLHFYFFLQNVKFKLRSIGSF